MSAMLDPAFDAMVAKRGGGAPGADGAGRRRQGHRRRGRRPARVHGQQGARAVRPRARAARPACCSSPPTSCPWPSRARGRPRRLPPVGLHARGDPPGAVHRRTRGCATTWSTQARALAVDLAPDPERARTRSPAGVAEKLPELFREGGTGLADLFATPEQREQARRAHRGDVAARGPRRRRDGRRRARRSSRPSRRSGRKFSERRKGAGAVDRLLRRLLGLEAKMRQYRDGAVLRARRQRQGRRRRASTPSGPRPETLPLARRDRASPRPGCAASTAERGELQTSR